MHSSIASQNVRRTHVCHILLVFLSTLESTELYEKLRVGYNKHRAHRPVIPPIEEWEGVGAYCDSLFCR